LSDVADVVDIVMQELKEHLTRVGEVTFADAHKEHLNEGLAAAAASRASLHLYHSLHYTRRLLYQVGCKTLMYWMIHKWFELTRRLLWQGCGVCNAW